MKTKYIMCIAVLVGMILAYAVDVEASSPHRRGTAGATELLIPVGATGVAMSGANLATARGLDALHWNPAGLAGSRTDFEVMFSHLSYIADIGVDYFAVAANLGDLGSIGASLKTLSMGSIDVTTIDQPEGTGFSYSPIFLTTGLSYSRRMTDRIYFGTNVKLIYQKIHLVEASAVGFDFGLQYRIGESGFRFGIVLKNIGSKMRFDGPGFEHTLTNPNHPPGAGTYTYRLQAAGFDLPTTLEGGFGYDVLFGTTSHLSLAATFVNNNYSNDEYRVGAEYSYNDMFFLRGGYTFVTDVPSGLKYPFGPTFGAGIRYGFGDVDVGIDYAYRVADFFDGNQWFTIRLGF